MQAKKLNSIPTLDILILSGRLVEIEQDRSAYVLFSPRFQIFFFVSLLLSFMLLAAVSRQMLPFPLMLLSWSIGGGLVVVLIYFILYVFINYTFGEKRVIILSPMLSLIALVLTIPILVTLFKSWLPDDSLWSFVTNYFFAGFLSIEIGFMVFVHVVRDPIIERYETERRRSEKMPTGAVRIGPETFPVETLCYIEAENQYVDVHLFNASIMIAGQLSAVERQLDTDEVFRPHRSFLVFRHGIAGIESEDGRSIALRMICGRKITVARRRMAPLRAWLAAGAM